MFISKENEILFFFSSSFTCKTVNQYEYLFFFIFLVFFVGVLYTISKIHSIFFFFFFIDPSRACCLLYSVQFTVRYLDSLRLIIFSLETPFFFRCSTHILFDSYSLRIELFFALFLSLFTFSWVCCMYCNIY